MHPDEGTILAYMDGELSGVEHQQVTQHLATCSTCQGTLAQMTQRVTHIQQSLNQLSVDSPSPRVSPSTARLGLIARLSEQEKQNMIQKWFLKRFRPVWAGFLVIAILALALAFPPVRAIANNFLGLFRVERITVVPVDQEQLSNRLGSSTQLENLMSENVTYQGGGESQQVQTPEDAGALANLAVRLPTAAPEPAGLLVQPGGNISMVINVRQLRAVLHEIDQDAVDIPGNLDGESVSVDIPDAVVALYGDCPDPTEEQPVSDPDEQPRAGANDCTTLTQMLSPTVTAPPDLNINQLGQVFLQMVGMSEEDALQFSESVDWTTTLVLPIPSYNTTYQDVTVDGVPGTLIVQGNQQDPFQYLLVWVKDGVVYALSGSNNPDSALGMANSMQ